MTRQQLAAERLRPADTDPKTWAVYMEIVRKMTPGQKLEMALKLSEKLRRHMQENPDWKPGPDYVDYGIEETISRYGSV